MSNLSKRMIKGGLIAAGFMMLAPMAASAGEWRINANRCPDLREDRYDRRHDNGWRDRREDRRDERVINCPVSAWYYVRSPGEGRYYRAPPRPSRVIIDRYHRAYYRDNRGSQIWLNFRL